MSSEVFRRVGRGGAGNWYSKKDVEDAEKDAQDAQDAQLPGPVTASPAAASPAAAAAAPAPYSRVGRGGAGNYYDAATAAAGRQQEAVGTANAVAHTSTHHVLSGRGGAGNWVGPDLSQSQAPAQDGPTHEQQRRATLEAQILQDVEAGLAMPAPAYHTQATRDSKKGPVSGLRAE